MSDQTVTRDQRIVPVGEGPLGFIVHFDFKPGWEEERTKQGYVDFIKTTRKEPTFVYFFRLEDRTNPNRVVLYETWNCSKEYFLEVEMKRPYREVYERILPSLVLTAREMQMDWRLASGEGQPLDPASDNREKFGFFVNFDVRPGREQEFRGVLDPLLDTMRAESRFVNYFLLQHETVPNRFVIYETWLGTPEEFLKIEMPRPYRQEYEAAVQGVLAKPREVERNWKLLYARTGEAHFANRRWGRVINDLVIGGSVKLRRFVGVDEM
jgi:quinol monooxygenase YgiN